MNALDYLVLIGTLLGIAVYGIWQTRGRRDLSGYLKGAGKTRWFVIGLSVMATQASAITFLSTPGQGYQDGLGFVQNYFGTPIALIVIAAFFLPIYRKLNVYTAYEFLGKRFDTKTRLLGAALFLLQRGIGAGITIYAPAIVLSTVFGWRLDLTIILQRIAGDHLHRRRRQRCGDAHAEISDRPSSLPAWSRRFSFCSPKLPAGLIVHRRPDRRRRDFTNSRPSIFRSNLKQRYTFWSGLIGGDFPALSYFGTDQSQVQRYISGASLRESRLGLMFNAVCKIPMQFFILLLGVMLFVFYQFATPADVLQSSRHGRVRRRPRAAIIQTQFADIHAQEAAI